MNNDMFGGQLPGRRFGSWHREVTVQVTDIRLFGDT